MRSEYFKSYFDMTKDELISKQQLKIESYKEKFSENREIINQIKGSFVSIGQPLNDNILQFNRDQLKWCMKVYDLIDQIETK